MNNKVDYKYSRLEPKSNKKPSCLTILIVGLLLLLACSLGYDKWLKPYLDNKKEQTKQEIVNAPQETDEISLESSDTEKDEIVEDADIPTSDPTEKKQTEPSKDAVPEVPTSNSTATQTTKTTSSNLPSRSEEKASTSEDYSGMSTIEIIERRNHMEVVKRAQRAGVSTEGTTLEIIERINHAEVVKQAQRAGVSTEGTTLEIIERINHADVVKQAQRAGVSTEGTTVEIIERINRKSLERMDY